MRPEPQNKKQPRTTLVGGLLVLSLLLVHLIGVLVDGPKFGEKINAFVVSVLSGWTLLLVLALFVVLVIRLWIWMNAPRARR